MSYRNIALIIAVVLFCLVFPSARIRHAFSGQYSDTTAPATATRANCDSSDAATVDHTVCGNVIQTVFDTFLQNITENLALIGVVSPVSVIKAIPAPNAAIAPPPATQTVAKPTATHMPTRPAQSPTLQKLQTATVVIPSPSATIAVLARKSTQASATLEPTTEPTLEPVATSTVAQPIPITPVLLPQSILDGFRSKMPVAGYWEHSSAGVYIAVGSFKYLKTYYSYEAPFRKRFVVCSLTIANTRGAGDIDIYVDRTNITLTDIDGRTINAMTGSDDLAQALQATRLAPGQRAGGQIAFMIDEYAAPGQLTVSVANMDAYLSRVDQTIELRVWPIVP